MPSEQPPTTRAECDCESVIGRKFLISGERQDGERVDCPRCGRDWVHICDEAEGCTWVRASKVDPAPPSEQPPTRVEWEGEPGISALRNGEPAQPQPREGEARLTDQARFDYIATMLEGDTDRDQIAQYVRFLADNPALPDTEQAEVQCKCGEHDPAVGGSRGAAGCPIHDPLAPSQLEKDKARGDLAERLEVWANAASFGQEPETPEGWEALVSDLLEAASTLTTYEQALEAARAALLPFALAYEAKDDDSRVGGPPTAVQIAGQTHGENPWEVAARVVAALEGSKQ